MSLCFELFNTRVKSKREVKAVFSVLFLFFITTSVAQKEFFIQEMDSIKVGYRSSGASLDLIDRQITRQPNLRPGAGFGEMYERNLADNLFRSEGGFSYVNNENKVIPKFTSLPYLGFQYAFGSSLTQDLNVEYHHFFQPNTHLHFKYNRNTSNGFLRNSDYKNNDVSLRFFHTKRRYTTHLDGYYGAYEMGQNGGITTDSLLNDFAIEFTPVNKETSRSVIRKLNLKWDNYYRLVGDSIVGFGVKSKHGFDLVGRTFEEQLIDTIPYDTLYLDTTGLTRDQFQTSGISTGAGVFFSSPKFKVDATLNHKYWRNQNVGMKRDTNEFFLHSNLWLKLGERLTLHNEFYFNLIGATGEIKEHARLNFKMWNNLSLTGQLRFENVYPTPYQRFHTSNYLKWEIQDLEMQQKIQVAGALKWGNKNHVQANVIWTSVNNGRYFIDNQWRQDTLDFVSVGALNIKGAYHLGKFSFYPSATLRFMSSNFSLQPILSTLNRLAYTTTLFKSGKLGFSVGVDVGYESSYNYMAYHEVYDVYQPFQSLDKVPELIQLNAFLALSIDEFRFFVKGENISYLFQDATTRIDPNYPIMPLLLRLGITWDFFN